MTIRMLSRLAWADGCVVRDHICHQSCQLHLLKELHCLQQLLGLLASDDDCGVCDHILTKAVPMFRYAIRHNGCAVGDHAFRQTVLPHLIKEHP